MDTRYQIFVSSTYEDLIEERKKATQAILKCECFPAGMELFPASSLKQWEIIKRVIDDSDFYLLIVAGRYGSLGTDENGKKVSYTEMEFDYAVSKGMPIIVMLHRRPDLLRAKFIETNKVSAQRLKKFREKASTERMVAFWENEDQLHTEIVSSLHNAMRDTPEAMGWVRRTSLHESGEQIKISNNVHLSKDYFNINWKEKMDSVTHDIFISGITLHRLGNMSELFKSFDRKKTIRLLSLDVKDDEVLVNYCKMRTSNHEKHLRYLVSIRGSFDELMGQTISENENIIEKTSKILLPYTYIAVDCNIGEMDGFKPNEKSFIEVYYFLIDKRPQEGVVSFTATYGTELYEELKKQIEIIWREAEETDRA
ncbi:MAG: DUF4062 domain-containing protein [Defluviitaleaceae bacterium]|nr:DUF4062 domain-containing protein [Defluviitaleaceae bacterium]